MLTVKIYNQQGQTIGETKLNQKLFGLPMDVQLIQQAVVSELSAKRQANAHTKTRGEVRGGGIKPWRQKGTGRARHGSIRSPIWIGGGVAFGPRNNRNFTKKMTAKAKRKALFIALSDRVTNNRLKVIDSLNLQQHKTREFMNVWKSLQVDSQSVLFITAGNQKNAILASRNVPEMQLIQANSLNVYDVLRHRTIIIEQAGLSIVEKTYPF